MSRYTGSGSPELLFRAADEWRKEALLGDGSVLSDGALWTLENLEALASRYVDASDEVGSNFLEKLEAQLAPATPAVKQLAAEMIWLILLCPNNIKVETKREQVLLIWSWSGHELSPDSPWLTKQVLAGVGNAGQGFNYNRWRELAFLIRSIISFKELSKQDQDKLLSDPWAFAEWITALPEGDSRQLRHMILFLLFPDTFERIFAYSDRKEIVSAFSDPGMMMSSTSLISLDQQLQKIRRSQEEKYRTAELDFYSPPLVSQWKKPTFAAQTKDVRREHVLAAIQEIDQAGIPPDAASTTYDLIHGHRRYPPKLVLSLATKHASGEEYDRALFSGGEQSQAFAFLRSLKFHIERKDFVGTLVGKFLGQADAAESLVTSAYPKAYRGLQVMVSFGKGNFAKIPWIAFLTPGQATSNGIYPVYLYYRDVELLILAYGISETAAPVRMWSNTEGALTVREFLKSSHGKDAERYGDSLVYASYRVPGEIHPAKLTTDLDKLIEKYEIELNLIEGEKPAPLAAPASTEPERVPLSIPEPYTLDRALEGLFMGKERFKSVLDLLSRKKNVILSGPPGVGKTYVCKRLAYALMKEEAPTRIGNVQFHQTYAYEDFVQGYRPAAGGGFESRNGLFYQFCERARDDQERLYVFIIDEINRGNLSKILGELMMLIESDKRSPDWAIPLVYSSNSEDKFHVPPNLYLIGLMNSADRSIAVVDYALRRRFAFVQLTPSFHEPSFAKYLEEAGAEPSLILKVISAMTSLNESIAKDTTNLGPGFCIGHSFFCEIPKDRPPDEDWFQSIVETEISPLLHEYWFENPKEAEKWINSLRLA
jgi:5-methylcytosine-specific restriction protein B